MKEPPVPGVGDFAVAARGPRIEVTLPIGRASGPWLPDLAREMHRRLRGKATNERAHTPPDHGRVAIIAVQPVHLGGHGKRYRSQLRQLEYDIWKAIRSFVRKQKERLRKVSSSRQKKRHVIRQPAVMLARHRRVTPNFGYR